MIDIQNGNLPRCLSLKRVALFASKRSIEADKQPYVTDFWRKGYAQRPYRYLQEPIYSEVRQLNPGSCVAPYNHFPGGDNCNKEGMPDKSLGAIGALEKAIEGKANASLCIGELFNSRPFVVAVFFSKKVPALGDTGGHVVVISAGFNMKESQPPSHPVWEVCNPWDNTRSLENYEIFPLYYYGDPKARWAQTCFTKQPTKPPTIHEARK
ncbi:MULTISPECIES: hypothetical protein [Photorhabdus]|uniref:Peptidase C39-like domain-containing protein n=2 Tax=Photorhabdus TaxID=29487 RepID=A0ABX0B390_9GAMM|nr:MULTISPECIES: hypothetical protein [Photorhabdus]MCC8374408.1 hypothetical protein [Photorhabdus bodei]MCT8352913.1 hypothetical protein [Photorhabdus kayaii]MDB6368340.1 hypothetical protein [Photorhabdus bodei]MDB6375098.1 hypothetical protein [Photorhabdus bodei]NDL12615.1 hypothetical protein [Photorhabdus kayaii]